MSKGKYPRISPVQRLNQPAAHILRIFQIALAASLTVSTLVFFACSWRWPLVGDASLIHYIAFLIERGWVPYRQLGDMNMPGSYLVELAAMHIFGPGDLAWRVFDFALLLAASAAFFAIANHPESNPGAPSFATSSQRAGFTFLPAVFASSLFILTHGRDGIAQGGQRDLTMAVCLIAATACLFRTIRRRSALAAAAFGLLSGIAFSIKPTTLPLTAIQFALALAALHKSSRANPLPTFRFAALAPLGYLIAPLISLIFLLREHALNSFLASLRTVVPYYNILGHRPLRFVLVNSLSTLQPLIIAWIIVLALRPPHISWTRNWERNILVLGVAFGVFNCIVQHRALPYYRYPLLVFLLPLIASDLAGLLFYAPASTSAPRRTTAALILAVLGLGFGGFFLAPKSAVLIHRYEWWDTDFISSLQQDLSDLGGPALSGHIQCIDSISGCGTVLYRMRFEPATGVLSDFLLFGNPSDRQPPHQIPIIRRTRADFSAAILAHPPEVIVVSSHLHIDAGENFTKLARWPAFADFLATRYTLYTEWRPSRITLWWSRPETPASYRIYVLRK